MNFTLEGNETFFTSFDHNETDYNNTSSEFTTLESTTDISTITTQTTFMIPHISVTSRLLPPHHTGEGAENMKIIVVAIICSLLFVILVIIVGIIIARRYCIINIEKIYFKKSMNLCPSKDPIQSVDYLTEYAILCKDSHLKLSEEFLLLKDVGKYQSYSEAVLQQNIAKNRYSNIQPYNATRVRLIMSEDDEGSDYINASWIPGYLSPRQYIASQGPMTSTQDDFWRMVWEYNCCAIVMLTKCIEKSKEKCHQYWPLDDEPVMYGDIEVKMTSEEVNDSWTVKIFNVTLGDQMRVVHHFHYLMWSDMDVPAESDSLLKFIELVRKVTVIDQHEIISPLIVHCSAGVGRTGAYIAIDTCLYQLSRLNSVDVFGVTYKMRIARCNMIQNETQYIFVYKTLADVIKSQNSAMQLDEAKNELNGDINMTSNVENM